LNAFIENNIIGYEVSEAFLQWLDKPEIFKKIFEIVD